MVRHVPRGREERQDPRQEAHAQGRRTGGREAGRHAARRNPRRGEGACREGREALCGRQEAVGAREADDVRFLVHQGAGLRIRRCIHARGHAGPGEAEDIRACTSRQEPGPGDQEPGRPDSDHQPLQRASARVVRDVLPGAGRLRPRQEIHGARRQVRREGCRHGRARDRDRIHRRRHGRGRYPRHHGSGRHPGSPLRGRGQDGGLHPRDRGADLP